MSTESAGLMMHSEDEEARRNAAALMGQARTEKKVLASRANAAKATQARTGKPMSEEHKAKLRAAYEARREREKQARIEAGEETQEAAERKPRGRPRKSVIGVEATTPKRGRGRPKKSETGGNTSLESETPKNGT